MSKIYFTLAILLMTVFSSSLYGQNPLSREREKEIKTSGKYYWKECINFESNEDESKQCAFDLLRTRIIQDAVEQSNKQEEALKAIETGAHFDRLQLQQEGSVKMIAWILKDSVFVTIKRPITQASTSQPTSSAPVAQQSTIEKKEAPPAITTASQPTVQTVSNPVSNSTQKTERNPLITDNPVLKELHGCKNQSEVLRVVRNNGLVRGYSSEGFNNPSKCIIAVFSSDGTLSALLDAGDSSRTDLLSGNTVQNPEQYYNRDQYYLWYILQ